MRLRLLQGGSSNTNGMNTNISIATCNRTMWTDNDEANLIFWFFFTFGFKHLFQSFDLRIFTLTRSNFFFFLHGSRKLQLKLL